MKKTIILFSVLFFLLTANAQFSGGNGSLSNPYQIASKEQLKSITDYNVEGVHFTLSSPIEYFDEWETIEEFNGIFDGGFHIMTLDKPFVKDNYGIIQNLGIIFHYEGDGPDSTWEGGFGAIACNQYGAAEINGCFVFGNITNMGKGQIGGIVGANHDFARVFNCKSYVNIQSNGEDVGGIIGYSNSDAYHPYPIDRCFTHGTIVGAKNVGGLCGRMEDGTIHYSHTYAMVYGHENAGGLVGEMKQTRQTVHISHGYAHGIVKGKRNIGGFVGSSNQFYIHPLSYSAARVDFSEVEDESYGLIAGRGYIGLEHILYIDWGINQQLSGNKITGIGGINSGNFPYVYTTQDFMQLDLYGTNPGYLTYPENFLEPQYEEWWYGWYNSFEDLLRERNYVLFNQLVNWECFDIESYVSWGNLVLYVNYKGNPDCSLFIIPEEEIPCFPGKGTIDNPYQISTPEQLDCMMDYLTENNGAGEHFRIMNDIDMLDYLNANYPSTGWRGNEITAFDGYLHGSGHIISNTFMSHTTSTTVGGLLAGTTVNAVIDSLGISFHSRGMYAMSEAGGLVGRNLGTISSCFTMGGNIITINDAVGTGGLVGLNEGIIENAYSTSNIIAVTSNYAGGLVGYNTGTITYTYAAAVVTGGANTGGLVGTNNGGRVRSSYYDKERTLQQTGIGSDSPGTENRYVYANTSEQMKNILFLEELDFDRIWRLYANRLPVLQWQKEETAPFSLIVFNEFTQQGEGTPLLNNNIKIYPNPTTGVVYIENQQKNTEIIVYDLNGALILKTNEPAIDLSSYPKGMYLLNINGKMEKVIKK